MTLDPLAVVAIVGFSGFIGFCMGGTLALIVRDDRPWEPQSEEARAELRRARAAIGYDTFRYYFDRAAAAEERYQRKMLNRAARP